VAVTLSCALVVPMSMLLPATVVRSSPQPDWLIDRSPLMASATGVAGRGRARAELTASLVAGA
jgi:hypothetical protein